MMLFRPQLKGSEELFQYFFLNQPYCKLYQYYIFYSRGEDLNKKNIGGWTPLMYGCYIGHDNVVNLLLDAGVNVNVTNPKGQTPLILAASCGNESVGYFLLQVHTYFCFQKMFLLINSFYFYLINVCFVGGYVFSLYFKLSYGISRNSFARIL